MSFHAIDPWTQQGRVIGNGHCVAFVQAVTHLGHTSTWRRGASARTGDLPRFTAIATFDPDGRYGNHTDGRSHAAILVAPVDAGLDVWDQWVGQPVAQRLVRFRNGAGNAVNDGDRFYAIETEGAA